jgi:PadR family transcriptional regulator PadR
VSVFCTRTMHYVLCVGSIKKLVLRTQHFCLIRTNNACMEDRYPLVDLTGFQRDLLVTIAKLDEPHGLKIKQELEEDYKEELHHGRLYPNLDTLVEKGLVEKGEIDRRTNSYSITRRGKRELRTHWEWQRDGVVAEATAD